jgi:amino acid transporter
LCYSELSLTIPKAGVDYIYIREAFGDAASFLVIWIGFFAVRKRLQNGH